MGEERSKQKTPQSNEAGVENPPQARSSQGRRSRSDWGPNRPSKDRGRGRGSAGGRERREGPADAGYRLLEELSLLEKALSQGDFAKQKDPLESIVKHLKPLRLRSIEQLDIKTRGRLITTLLRVGRQPKPPGVPVSEPAAAAGGEAPKSTEAPESSNGAAPSAKDAQVAEVAAGEAPQSTEALESSTEAAKLTEAPESSTEAAKSTEAPESSTEAAPSTGAPDSSAEAAAAPAQDAQAAEAAGGEPSMSAEAAPPPATTASAEAHSPHPDPVQEGEGKVPVNEKATAYADVMALVGMVWREVGDDRRAAHAFAASGRPAEQREAVKAMHQSGDWREEAKLLESQKRTRDAARLHERHQSYGEAARLFELAGDQRAALSCAFRAKDHGEARRLLKLLKPEEAESFLQKMGAHELLMEHFVDSGNYEKVAQLYERSRQFDQAALAWERAGKLSQARKAFERAKDSNNASRVRQLEVEALVTRGDRLGAALLLLGEGKREQAAQTLSGLPAPKAFRFLQKARLDEEAIALARKEIRRADSEKDFSTKARWLEWLGELSAAAESWEAGGRKDKAQALYEQVGDWGRAAELAEAIGRREKAIELYHRAGDKTSAERLANEAPPQAEPQRPESAPLGDP